MPRSRARTPPIGGRGASGRSRSPTPFVRKFGEWCGEHGVKGKYSIVPYPGLRRPARPRACPAGRSRNLHDSLELVRTLMMPNWDIHPEMVTHTRVIDTKTGHPYPDHSLQVHGELGLDDRPQRRRARRLHGLCAAHPEERRPAVRGHHHARRVRQRGAAAARAGHAAVGARCLQGARSRTTSGTFYDRAPRAWRRASNMRAASTAPIRAASSASSAAPATGPAAGTTRRRAASTSSSPRICKRAAWSR